MVHHGYILFVLFHQSLFPALCAVFDQADITRDGTISIAEYMALCEAILSQIIWTFWLFEYSWDSVIFLDMLDKDAFDIEKLPIYQL